jgi:hypothetical protein
MFDTLSIPCAFAVAVFVVLGLATTFGILLDSVRGLLAAHEQPKVFIHRAIRDVQ